MVDKSLILLNNWKLKVVLPTDLSNWKKKTAMFFLAKAFPFKRKNEKKIFMAVIYYIYGVHSYSSATIMEKTAVLQVKEKYHYYPEISFCYFKRPWFGTGTV